MSDFTYSIPKNTEKISKKQKNRTKIFEKIFEKGVLIFSLVSLICVIIITIFIFAKGLPAINEIGFKNFILGQKWNPDKEIFGILPMILGTFIVTFIALLIGIPIGLFTGIFITFYANKPLKGFVTSAVELLGNIPSVIYGFFGLIVIVPIINNAFGGIGAGSNTLSASIILAIMILPTIIITTKMSLSSVPVQYIEGSIALGASKEQTIFKVVLPASKSGILSGMLLGTGRAIGETMAILLVAGNTVLMPSSSLLETLTNPVRTLTANVALEMSYATGLHQGALFATGVVLFIFIIFINIIGYKFNSKSTGLK